MQNIYYGKQTENAIENFGYGKMHRDFIRAFGEVKKAAVLSAFKFDKKTETKIFDSIKEALDLVINGEYDEQFVVPFKQGGAGTSVNMNFNEVIANVAEELYEKNNGEKENVDSIEDINKYQSTNDVFSTAVTVMSYRHLEIIEKKIINLQERLITLENELEGILIAGRTELQSALPIMLSQVFGAWAGSIERDRWRLNKLKERIRNISLGGTAVGTCFFAPREYVFEAERLLRNITGLPVSRSQNLPDEISNLDKYSELANGYKLIGENLYKITSDLLLYTSDFLNEIEHPNLQYGSSIMAAKTNPVILEFVKGVSINITSNCNKISEYTKNGQMQLNVFLPFITGELIEVYEDITKSIDIFIEKFLDLMTINNNKIKDNLEKSYVLVNSLIPKLGYNKVKELYLKIKEKGVFDVAHLITLVAENTDLTKEFLEEYFDPYNLITFSKR